MKIIDIKKDDLSLAMQQYYDFKIKYLDSIVFFQLGDFYEMFFEDAVYAAKNISLTLTKKSAGLSEKVPLAGIPINSCDDYVKKLIELDKKVVIINQKPKDDTKKIVERFIYKIVTPGSYYDETNAFNNFVGAIVVKVNSIILSYGDINTGEMYYTKFESLDTCLEFLKSRNIREILVEKPLELDEEFIVSTRFLEYDMLTPEVEIAQKLLLDYFDEILCGKTKHLKSYILVDINSNLKMNFNTINQLDLVSNDENSLFNFVNHTHTAMGKRMLRDNMLNPLTDVNIINDRHDFIDFFSSNIIISENVKESLVAIYDIERFISKISEETINPKELENLKLSLKASENIFTTLNYPNKSLEIIKQIDFLIKEDAPLSTKDGYYINDGVNEQIDYLRDIKTNSTSWLIKFENEEVEKTGIKNLKVKYNRIFGYFIEVTNSYKDLVPESYVRKQTTANAERYITDELKKVENEILNATDKVIAIELEIFNEFKVKLKEYIELLFEVANKIAYIDMIFTFYIVSTKYDFVKPNFGDKIEIIGGFHPIIKSKVANFIDNDILVDKQNILLITGPNMAGKSTYMRQMAIISILAQIGCFVPAKSCEIKIFDQIFTRIGANDNLANNQSTFMVEMAETAVALKQATHNSLLLFDELGRGTSTYDGIALAQSILEYLTQHVNPVLFFSTHYHELVLLEEKNEFIKNIHVKAIKENNKLVFLHKVHPGGVEKSYGIEVASLANLPIEVIARANLLINELDNMHVKVEKKEHTEINIINEKEKILLAKIKDVDINNITPIEALNLIANLKSEL